MFIDAGAYDGGTILDFVQWTGGKYQKIYAMEPLHDMYCRIKEMCEQKHVDHIDTREIAAWNKEEKLYFTEELTGSRVEEEGRIVVNGGDIDSIAKEDRVTYIKMDIEGSELKALEGAKKRYRETVPSWQSAFIISLRISWSFRHIFWYDCHKDKRTREAPFT